MTVTCCEEVSQNMHRDRRRSHHHHIHVTANIRKLVATLQGRFLLDSVLCVDLGKDFRFILGVGILSFLAQLVSHLGLFLARRVFPIV